jgi:hypothetical protein
MLFDFYNFIQELRENKEKKEIIAKYEKYYGPITGDVVDQVWYTEYVANFDTTDYIVPEELKEDFDRKLLIKFVAASFSSEWVFDTQVDGDLPEFVISVQSGDQLVVKKVSELRWFQILRLYEIYAEEQMNLQILMAEEEKEKDAIAWQRSNKIARRKLVLESINKAQEEKEENQAKKEKLQDLYKDL